MPSFFTLRHFHSKLLPASEHVVAVVGFFCAVLFLGVLALSSSGVWVSLQQIAMGDMIAQSGNFTTLYPDPKGTMIFPASPYFPGVAILSYLISNIIPASIFEFVFLFSACFIIIILSYLQYKILLPINDRIIPFLAFTLLVYAAILTPFAIYAVQFKPDAISLCFGLAGLILFNKPTGFSRFGIAPFLFAAGIIFKQQYLFYEIGVGIVGLYYLLKRDYALCSFLVIAAIWTLVFIAGIFLLPTFAYYHTISALANDPLMSLKTWLGMNKGLLQNCGIFIVALFAFTPWNAVQKNAQSLSKQASFLPYFAGAAVYFLGSILSSFKDGGDDGNTALALVLFVPLLYQLVRPIGVVKLLALILFACSLLYPQWHYMEHRVMQARAYEDAFVQLAQGERNSLIYIDVTFYNAARRAQMHHIHDGRTARWTATREIHTGKDALWDFAALHHPEFILHYSQAKMDPKEWKRFTALMQKNGYKLVFSNDFGIIIQRQP